MWRHIALSDYENLNIIFCLCIIQYAIIHVHCFVFKFCSRKRRFLNISVWSEQLIIFSRKYVYGLFKSKLWLHCKRLLKNCRMLFLWQLCGSQFHQLLWLCCYIRCQFHHHFTQIFRTSRSQICKKILTTLLSFLAFGICMRKSCS